MLNMKAMNGAATNPFKLQTTSPAATPLHWQSGECDGTNCRGKGQATDVGEDSSLEANVFFIENVDNWEMCGCFPHTAMSGRKFKLCKLMDEKTQVRKEAQPSEDSVTNKQPNPQ
jgi:hypothetical protein